jgi:peptidoglycan/xylan/chitin deacetylase (PgdA/CDA1 family)
LVRAAPLRSGSGARSGVLRTLAAALVLGLAAAPALFGAAPEPVLAAICYHRFGPETRLDPYRISTQRLGEQMGWLRSNGWQAVSLSQVAAALSGDASALPAKGVLLSVDDGYKAGALGAAVFEHYGYRAVYFVYPSVLGHGAFLGWDDLRALEARGFEVACHTLSHPNLAKVPAGMDAAAYAAWVGGELVESKRILERNLGHPVQALAWPYGAYNPALVAAAKRAGYSQLWTVSGGLNRVHALDGMRLRRILLMGSPPLKSFSRRMQANPVDAPLQGLAEGDLVYRSQLPLSLRVGDGAQASLGSEPLGLEQGPGSRVLTLGPDLADGFHYLILDEGSGPSRRVSPILFQVAPDAWKPCFAALTSTP